MFHIPQKCNNQREDMMSRGLTGGAVFSIVAGVGAVTLIFVLTVAHTHTPVLTGEITARIDCGQGRSVKHVGKRLHKAYMKSKNKQKGDKTVQFSCFLIISHTALQTSLS